jgi:hypothetical protein
MRDADLLESRKHTIPTRNISCRLGQWIEQARHNTTTRGRERRNQRGDTESAKPLGEFVWHKPRGSICRITATRNPGNPKTCLQVRVHLSIGIKKIISGIIAAGAGYQSFTDHLIVGEEKYGAITKAFLP